MFILMFISEYLYLKPYIWGPGAFLSWISITLHYNFIFQHFLSFSSHYKVISQCKGIPRFIALHCIAFHRCVFPKLKASKTVHQQKDYDLLCCNTCFIMLAGTKPAVSLRKNTSGSFIFLDREKKSGNQCFCWRV